LGPEKLKFFQGFFLSQTARPPGCFKYGQAQGAGKTLVFSGQVFSGQVFSGKIELVLINTIRISSSQ
jgi:hypothetical protein